jgi:hypothetical protein
VVEVISVILYRRYQRQHIYTHRALGVEVDECPCGKGVGKSVFTYIVFSRNLLRNCVLCAYYLEELIYVL